MGGGVVRKIELVVLLILALVNVDCQSRFQIGLPLRRPTLQSDRKTDAEHHEQTAKAHRTAAQQHGSNDHASAKQQSAQAVDKSKAAHEHSTQANNKSQQQK
jgi:hypothetical protein